VLVPTLALAPSPPHAASVAADPSTSTVTTARRVRREFRFMGEQATDQLALSEHCYRTSQRRLRSDGADRRDR
jgi:hypothetical protein